VHVRGIFAGSVAVVALVGASLAGADTAPVVSAHRAAVSGFAENSLAGFTAAAEAGETDIEGDVYTTKDGVLVLSHDSPLRAGKCAGPYLDVPLRELEAAQLEEMTCAGEPVARLSDAIEALRPHPGVTLRIEIKNTEQDTSEQRTADAVLLARQLADAGMTEHSILRTSTGRSPARPSTRCRRRSGSRRSRRR
jgi:glycerophosphoryl diester phosphodiesterase